MSKKDKILKWKKIENENVRNLWECPICRDKAYIEPDWYSDNGTPVCFQCEEDMIYVYTEIFQ